ncbi:unnamed protein product [Lathyrus oleraceus]|uniref:uncharacterized protein LOC127105649 n=1 Tax=Pisum sativum TaxID=3888 RepID=UPI001FC3FE63|nr:uncharacterized protein LOC127105649 [Pisum sativum]
MRAENQPCCVLRFCGVSNGDPGPSGAAAILLAEDRTVLYRFREGLGHETVNAAEYRALILGLKQARAKGYDNIIVEGDSRRVINQIWGYELAPGRSRRLWMEALVLKNRFRSFDIQQIPRVENGLADCQANQAVNLGDGEVEEDDVGA